MGASSSTPVPGSCVAGNTTFGGRVCSMQCGIDYPGGDLRQMSVKNYAECLEACASDPVCTDAQFGQAWNVCFLKSSLTTPRGASDIDSAVCYAQQNASSISSSSAVPAATITVTVSTTFIVTTTAVSTSVVTSQSTTTATFVSTETDVSTTTVVSTQSLTSTATATATKIEVTTTVSTLTITSTATSVTTETASFTTTATAGGPTLAPSVCTFTYTTTTTLYTSTRSLAVYTLPTKCYDSAIVRSLVPSTTTAPLVSVSVATTYACSATVQTISTTTVTGVYTATATYAWPFYVQAVDSKIDNGSYGQIVTYDTRVGNSFLTFVSQAQGSATQMSLDNNCALTLGYNTTNPDWYAVDQGGALVYFGNTAEIGRYSHNATCAVDASSILTCRTSYGNTTYLNGNDTRDSRFNNDLQVAPANLTQDPTFHSPIYPVTLGLTFLPAPPA